MPTPHPYGTPQAQRLEARFDTEFQSCYDDTPYSKLVLRLVRSTSWLARAEQELFERETDDQDPDAAFIFYWIAFNSAYGENSPDENELVERTRFNDYIGRLLFHDFHDGESTIYNALWNSVSRDVALLFIDNQYLYWRFWKHHRGIREHSNWRSEFSDENQDVRRALDRTVSGGKALSLIALQDCRLVLKTLFDRMYVLRNQLVHGGATYRGKVNRKQVHYGARIMALLVPLFIDLMMNKSDVDWGVPEYPPIFED